MGFCCSKKAASVVDTKGRRPRVADSSLTTIVPTIDFDVLVPEDATYLLPAVSSFPPGLENSAVDERPNGNLSIRTLSEYDTCIDAPVGHTTIMGDNLSFTLAKNGSEEVRPGDVDFFVKSIRSATLGNSHNMLEDAFFATSFNGTRGQSILRATINSSNAAVSFTSEQKDYLDSGMNYAERLARLTELEQMSRQEIFSAWQVNSVLLRLAWNRVVPTVRRCRSLAKNSKVKPSIQTRDIDGSNEGSHLRESYKSQQVSLYTPSEIIEEKEHTKKGSVEHYQLLTLSGRGINVTANVRAEVVGDSWDFLSLPDAKNHINAGNAYFRFVCCPAGRLKGDSLELIDTFINLTCFKDELKENNVPKIDIFSTETQNKNVVIMVKTMYLLPGVLLETLTPELLSSLDYQSHCQPGDTKFEKIDEPYTFRTVKTLIKFVFSVTIQMRVSEITDVKHLQSFVNIDGMTPTRVIMLERTKKNIAKTDSTVKVRSFLIYYAVNDGFLVTNQTIVLNSSIPRVVSSLMHTFGSQGAKEAAETAKLTRKYLIDHFGDSRVSRQTVP